MIGCGLIATAVLVHVKVGPQHKGSDFGMWNGAVVAALFVFGGLCIAVSTEGVQ